MDQNGRGRRQVVKAVLGAAGIALARPFPGFGAQASPTGSASQSGTLKLADNLFVLTLPGEPNVVVQTGGGGALLVDGCSARSTDALMNAVAALPGGGPVHTLFNTHWHPEQTGSNEQLGKAGRTIIAHENTRLWLTTDVTWPWDGRTFTRLAKVAQPNKTFYDTGTLETGVRYGYISDAAHTDGDMYVYFPQQNVLVVGDAVSGQGWPVVDWVSGGWIGGMVGGVQRLQTVGNAETRVVPARGAVLGMQDLRTQYDMYGTIYDRLTQLLNKGRSPGEAVAAKPTKEYDALMGNGDEFVRRSFESLWAYLSPDA